MLWSVVQLLQKTEGRDKLVKLLVYVLKLWDAVQMIRHGHETYRFERIAIRFQQSRQCLRIAKPLWEYFQLTRLLRNPSPDEFSRLAQVFIHTVFVCYWALDTLTVLSFFNLINTPTFQVSQAAMTVKLLALIVGTLFNMRTWLRLHHAQLLARRALRYLQGNDNLRKGEQIRQLQAKQWKMLLLCIKFAADIVPTVAKGKITRTFLTCKIPRVAQALGGIISAVASCLLTDL